MQSRLARIFNPHSNRTVMLAFDHGYFQGPTTGLERIDLSIAPLFADTDVADVHPRRTAQPGTGGHQ
ncbi:Autoinducer 2 (AI-2) aldolase LsrF [Klebsiella pneumoniae]|nr:Autoinducer 2 (AI-2) aldolase LsrF [Klebsiella pneumoniae]